MSKIRVAELFAGYGSQSMALERLKLNYPEFDYEVVLISEIEPNALKAYEATHGYCPNVGDISQVVWSEQPDFDLATWSFPCTDISGAGKQMGLSKDSGTQSSLCWEAIRCFKAKRPKFLLMENVAALAQRRFIKDFHALQYELEQIGYTNFCAILDSSKYGVPQHRERLFMISILDCAKSYHFPEPFKLEKRIKDILEPYGTVDESFYFSPEQLLRIIANTDKSDVKVQEGISIHPLNRKMEFQGFRSIRSDTAPCLTSHDGEHGSPPVLWQRLSIYGNNAQRGRIYDIEGICPAIMAHSTGGGHEPKILTPVRTEEAKALRRKGIEVFKHRELVPREDGVSNTITTVQKDNLLIEPTDRQSRIRSKVMPNGNIRFFQDDESKSGISEMQIIHPDNECPTITTAHVPKILEPMVGNDPRKAFDVLQFSDVCPTLLATDYKSPKLVREPIELSFANLPDKTVLKDEDGRGYLWQDGSLWRIRRLTGKEVFRLMDVSDEDIEKIQSYPFKSYAEREKAIKDATARNDKKELNRIKRESISKTAQYSLAGNSIVVQCLICIFENLFVSLQSRYNKSNHPIQLSLF